MRKNRKNVSKQSKSLVGTTDMSSDKMKAAQDEIKALQIFSRVFNIKL